MIRERLAEWLFGRLGFSSVTAAARKGGIFHNVLQGWVTGKRQPRGKVFFPVLDRLGIPRAEFVGLVDPPRPACRYCGKFVSFSTWQKIRRRDPDRTDFSHRACRGEASIREDWPLVSCTSCPNAKRLSPQHWKALKWKEERDGKRYRICGSCSRRLRKGALAPILQGLPSEVLPEDEKEWLVADYREGRPEAVQRVSAILRKWFSGVRQDPTDRQPRAGKQAGSDRKTGKQAQAARRRPRRAVGPRFRLCPICGLVVYAQPELPRFRFHPPCWKVFKRTPEYRRWAAEQKLGARLPFPWPAIVRDRGRPTGTPPTLLRWYEMLILRHGLRARWRYGHRSSTRLSIEKVAKCLHISERAVTKGTRAFIEQLPGRWDFVFQYRATGFNRDRARKFPLPAHRGDRTALARMLLVKGMAAADVAALIGEPLPKVRDCEPQSTSIRAAVLA